MKTIRLLAEEIAQQQLLQALRLWHEGDYVSAITLAGASEEILGKRLRKIGKEPSFDSLKNFVMLIARKQGDVDPASEKIISKLMNSTRNELKHYAGDESLEFDLKADSIELLERAISNFTQLTGLVHDDMYKFWDETSGS